MPRDSKVHRLGVVREKEALPSLRFCPEPNRLFLSAPGGHEYVCGQCGAVLARGPKGMTIPGAVRCPSCSAWNCAER